jgi:hypothetical protein
MLRLPNTRDTQSPRFTSGAVRIRACPAGPGRPGMPGLAELMENFPIL